MEDRNGGGVDSINAEGGGPELDFFFCFEKARVIWKIR